MSTNQAFLSPRELLINSTSFCCDGPTFKELEKALLSVEGLPYSQDWLQQLSGLSSNGYNVLVIIMNSILEECLNIVTASSILRSEYHHIADICDRTLEVASTTKSDYDEIFDGLEKLFTDPTNEDLRNRVNQAIDARLYNIGILSDIASATTQQLVDSTKDLTEYQKKLKTLGDALDNPDIPDKLAGRDQDPEQLQADIAAVAWIKGMIDDVNLEDQSAASLSNLQTLLGAVAAITSDLSSLSESFAESAHPGPGLLLDTEKGKLLELWDLLAAEVQEFKNNYSISRKK